MVGFFGPATSRIRQPRPGRGSGLTDIKNMPWRPLETHSAAHIAKNVMYTPTGGFGGENPRLAGAGTAATGKNPSTDGFKVSSRGQRPRKRAPHQIPRTRQPTGSIRQLTDSTPPGSE